MPSGYAIVGFPEDQILLVTPHGSSLDAVCPLVIKGVSEQTEVSASDRHLFPLVPIHVFWGTPVLRNWCISVSHLSSSATVASVAGSVMIRNSSASGNSSCTSFSASPVSLRNARACATRAGPPGSWTRENFERTRMWTQASRRQSYS